MLRTKALNRLVVAWLEVEDLYRIGSFVRPIGSGFNSKSTK
jgi:hypothetical protein